MCSDICGPFVESPQGFTYACNFYDKYSHHAAVYFMKTKEAEEIRRCHDTYLSDHKQWLKDGKITEWVVDDGLNFHSRRASALAWRSPACAEPLRRPGGVSLLSAGPQSTSPSGCKTWLSIAIK